jgi:glycine cleavage system aminomethyltransferase T
MKPFNVAFAQSAAFGEAMIARTGYTGEDGLKSASPPNKPRSCGTRWPPPA